MTYRNQLGAIDARIQALETELEDRSEKLDELHTLRAEMADGQAEKSDSQRDETTEVARSNAAAEGLSAAFDAPLHMIGLYWSKEALIWLFIGIGLFLGALIGSVMMGGIELLPMGLFIGVCAASGPVIVAYSTD